MSGHPKRDKYKKKDGARDLKTHHNESHNHCYARERLVQLVKLLARRAAETDFDGRPPHQLDQGGIRHDTTH